MAVDGEAEPYRRPEPRDRRLGAVASWLAADGHCGAQGCSGPPATSESILSFQKYTDVICTGWAVGCNYNASTGATSRNSTKNPDYFRHSADDATEGGEQNRIQSLFDDERMGGCILNIAGVTVGVEVCLDHIASTAPSLGRASRYSGTIQILLIPSYGMSIGNGLYCRTGGVVFNVDGRGHGRSHLALNSPGNPAPQKIGHSVIGGRGSMEVWNPVPIPQ